MSTNEHIRCKECGVTFEFLAADLRRFEAKGWQPPKRCRECRTLRRERNEGRDLDGEHLHQSLAEMGQINDGK